MATKARVVGFVVDMFCLTMTEVADEFSIPTYLYFSSGASFLSFTMFMQRLTDEHGADITEFKDSDEKLPVPGFVNPVPATVTPSILLDKCGSVIVTSSARLIWKTRWVFINTFQELEPDIIQSLSADDQLPPVYAVGPLLNFQTPPESEFSDVIEFIDQQPPKSVVFLCFGSQGSFSDPQIKQQAAALESSGRRFLWCLRRGNQSDFTTPAESVLPAGFLERTRGVGKVIGWGQDDSSLIAIANTNIVLMSSIIPKAEDLK
ncbi:hypothetical protein SASPL_133093 [Salvia splendens]|uniref:Uncharacterized protein n=1 Tax=Salvia splendens TaxID=180675 RepID=A0A8X8X2D7_SALSN|nr:UDP-glucose flavonoid 3-O-glucosyltransferase 6-like [Salvia splendens]KAG6405503.1 hypothetical protein SASPL_133093 [Salvia splendens]